MVIEEGNQVNEKARDDGLEDHSLIAPSLVRADAIAGHELFKLSLDVYERHGGAHSNHSHAVASFRRTTRLGLTDNLAFPGRRAIEARLRLHQHTCGRLGGIYITSW